MTVLLFVTAVCDGILRVTANKNTVKVKLSVYRLGQAIWLQEVEASVNSRQSPREGGQGVSLMHRPP